MQGAPSPAGGGPAPAGSFTGRTAATTFIPEVPSDRSSRPPRLDRPRVLVSGLVAPLLAVTLGSGSPEAAGCTTSPAVDERCQHLLVVERDGRSGETLRGVLELGALDGGRAPELLAGAFISEQAPDRPSTVIGTRYRPAAGAGEHLELSILLPDGELAARGPLGRDGPCGPRLSGTTEGPGAGETGRWEATRLAGDAAEAGDGGPPAVVPPAASFP